MSAAGSCCLALQTASFSRVAEAWRMAIQMAGYLLAVAGLLGLFVLPPSAVAQARAGVPRIGILFFGAAPVGASPDIEKGYLQGLRELGYVEGQNIHIERRYGQGRHDQMALLAAELVQLKVEVMIAAGPGPRETVRSATRSIPIVTVSGADPVREG
jgi:putative tryptophan/tyrosine transport system substrate-binding protein